MTRNGMDISNYTQPLTPPQLDYVRDNLDWVCIGLQDARKARAFKAQLEPLGKQLMYYIERPGRDLTIPDPGAIVWVDIETGCFVERNETLQALADVETRGLVPYVYGNKWSIQPVFGDSTELSRYPLSYADYRTPDLATFVAFNGFDKPFIWQFSSNGIAGINCDLCVSFDEALTETISTAPSGTNGAPRTPYVTEVETHQWGYVIRFSDGGFWNLGATSRTGSTVAAIAPPPGSVL